MVPRGWGAYHSFTLLHVQGSSSVHVFEDVQLEISPCLLGAIAQQLTLEAATSLLAASSAKLM